MVVLFFAHKSRQKINYIACARAFCDLGIPNTVHNHMMDCSPLLFMLQVDWIEPGKDGKMTQDW